METQKKQFKFRGKSLEELKAMDTREFASLIRSKERRFILRNFQEIENFVSHAKEKQAKKKRIKTHNRELVVVPQMVGMQIQVHRGNQFIPFDVTEEMLGHRFGEFAPTRNRVAHTKAGVGATKGSMAKSKK